MLAVITHRPPISLPTVPARAQPTLCCPSPPLALIGHPLQQPLSNTQHCCDASLCWPCCCRRPLCPVCSPNPTCRSLVRPFRTPTYHLEAHPPPSPATAARPGRLGVPRHRPTWLPPTFIATTVTTALLLTITASPPSTLFPSPPTTPPSGLVVEAAQTRQRPSNLAHGPDSGTLQGTQGRISCQRGLTNELFLTV